MEKYLIGIDVGFSNMGILVMKVPELEMVQWDVIQTQPQNKVKGIRKLDDDMERVKQLSLGLREVCYKFQNENIKFMAVAEMPHGGAQSSRAARAMGISSAVAVSVFSMCEIPIEFVYPQDAKLALTGNKNASKDDMIYKAVESLEGEYEPDTKGGVYKFSVGDPIRKGKLEHLADAYGAIVYTVNNSEMYKVFVR